MPTTSLLHSWLLWVWLVGMAGLLVQRPVDHPDLWWHLARGREVCAGSVSPSRTLLVLDEAGEADWLGGVPFYLGWEWGGVPALAVTPLCAAVTVIWLARHSLTRTLARALLGLPLIVWTMRAGLQPIPQIFDLAGMAATWWLLHRRRASPTALRVDDPLSRPSTATLAAICGLFAVWANLAPGPVWGLLTLCLLAPADRFDGRLPLAALLGGCFTPRGLLTWRDSLILFAPSAFQDLAAYAGPGGTDSTPGIAGASVAFAVLWGGWTVVRLRAWRTWPRGSRLVWLSRLSVPPLALLLTPHNLPLCGLWILLDLTSSASADGPALDGACQTVQVADETAGAQRTTNRVGRWLAPFASAVVLLSLAWCDASGWGSSRLGWGIAHSLDIRLFNMGQPGVTVKGLTAWASDGRSVGVGAWLGARMVDHPQRALLAGRELQHARLVEDLVGAHRARYRLDDGSWGGWVQRLDDWNVELLLLRAEDVRLNHALFETPWKPVVLDSPTVPYGQGSDLRFAQAVVASLRQQSFVECGLWQPTASIYNGRGWRSDFLEMTGFGPDPSPAIRQSQFFRALNIPMASLRALLPVRQQTRSSALNAEFRACQVDLATQEWLTSGKTSDFRQYVVRLLDPGVRGDAVPEEWRAGLDHYLHGRVAEAVRDWPSRGSSEHYAAGLLWLELGETSRARDALEQVQPLDDLALFISAKGWIEQIDLLNGP